MSDNMPQLLPNSIQEHVSLKRFNTFRFEAKARYFALIHTLEELVEVLQWANKTKTTVTPIGEGSNLLIVGDIDGLVLVNRLKGLEVKENGAGYLLTAAAGENWHETVTYAVNNQMGGLENLALIPGTVGASPIQNIGAYGVEVKDCIQAVQVIDRHTLETHWLDVDTCEFGYRDSRFKRDWQQKYIIIAVRFALTKEHSLSLSYAGFKQHLPANPTIQDVYQTVCKVRSEKLPDPKKIGNAGSFFKNPVIGQTQYEDVINRFPKAVAFQVGDKWKLAAGWLIDQAGWKGFYKDGVGVYEKQALCLVNHSSDDGCDLLRLEESIKTSILEKFGIELEREPILLPQ